MCKNESTKVKVITVCYGFNEKALTLRTCEALHCYKEGLQIYFYIDTIFSAMYIIYISYFIFLVQKMENLISNSQNDNEEEILLNYFLRGFNYLEIIELLKLYHNLKMSLSTLKRKFKKLGLYRRPLAGRRLSLHNLKNLLSAEFHGSGSNIGYRRIWAHLRHRGEIVRREDVRLLMLEIDPEGVYQRKRKKLRRRKYYSPGPNAVWHIDGYDKLKPFGFSFHGCMDGFSRRLIWLEVSVTNKKPEEIASYYINAVKSLGGIPQKVNADDGTEHSIIQPIHVYLKSLDDDSRNAGESFSIVTSTKNQRIESYWSKFRGDRMGWWRLFFQDLVDADVYDPSNIFMLECARFTFLSLMRKELKELAMEWNQHIISKSKNTGPRGRPNTMFFLPHLYNSQSFLQEVETENLSEFDEIVTNLPKDVSDEFNEFALTVMEEDGKELPNDPYEGLNMYFYLLQKISQYI